MLLPNQPWLEPKLAPEVRSTIVRVWEELARLLNGNLQLGSVIDGRLNIEGAVVNIPNTGTADTEFSVTHNLGYVPASWLVFSIDKSGVTYLGGTAWTATLAYLKCSIANANLTIFVF